MRLALLEVERDVRGRAAHVHRWTEQINEAAEREPAPDLIVLPGGLDTGGAAPVRSAEAAHRAMIRETLAWKAREWGVYLAAGLHGVAEKGWAPCAVLFDPDGDIVAATGEPMVAEASVPSGMPRTWKTPVGTLGVWDPHDSDRVECDPGGVMLWIVPWWGPITAAQEDAWERTWRLRGRGHWALVMPGPWGASARARRLRSGLYIGGRRVGGMNEKETGVILAEIPAGAGDSASWGFNPREGAPGE